MFFGELFIVSSYMTPEQFESVAAPLVQELSSEQWEELCRNIPSLQVAAERSINPFVEITHLHKAIRKELEVSYGLVCYDE